MFNWLRRRRLSSEAKRKMLIIAARSEEAILATHVSNALELLRALGDEVDLDRGIGLYEEMMSLDGGFATTVRNRILARVDASAATDAEQEAGRFSGVFGSCPKRARSGSRRRR